MARGPPVALGSSALLCWAVSRGTPLPLHSLSLSLFFQGTRIRCTRWRWRARRAPRPLSPPPPTAASAIGTSGAYMALQQRHSPSPSLAHSPLAVRKRSPNRLTHFPHPHISSAANCTSPSRRRSCASPATPPMAASPLPPRTSWPARPPTVSPLNSTLVCVPSILRPIKTHSSSVSVALSRTGRGPGGRPIPVSAFAFDRETAVRASKYFFL